MFRNLRFYRVHSTWPADEEKLSELLESVPFKPCTGLVERSAGWVAPVENAGDRLARRVGGFDVMRLRTQSRILPPAAVNEALEERVAQFESRTRRPPGRREKRELKEDVFDDLLPRALVKSDYIWGCHWPAERILGIDTASESTAERFCEQLREALGSLEITPLAFGRAASELLNQVFLGEGPVEFQLGRECRMQDPSAKQSFVTWQDMELSDAGVRRHVKTGLQLTRLGLVFDNRASFVLDDANVLRKLKLLGMDQEDELPDEDPVAKFDATFVIHAGVLQQVLQALGKRLGGYA